MIVSCSRGALFAERKCAFDSIIIIIIKNTIKNTILRIDTHFDLLIDTMSCSCDEVSIDQCATTLLNGKRRLIKHLI